MLKNYLKIALRKLRRNLAFGLITVLCLTVGFASFILIYVYIQHERSFDRFHTDYERIYRLLHHVEEETGERITAQVSPQLVLNARSQISSIEDITFGAALGRITVGNDLYLRDYERIILADTNFFDFFDFKVLQGEGRSALSTPNGLLMTESKARKYFKGELPSLGDSVFTNWFPAQISAILADPPENSHLQFGLLVPQNVALANFPWYKGYIESNWAGNTFACYVKLPEGTDASAVGQELSDLLRSNLPEEANQETWITLQPLKEVHFTGSEVQGGAEATTTRKYYLVLFGTIGLLVLLVAAFNYTNLSTAAALYRTREIGLRKTIGASRQQLTAQFFTESLVLTLVSLLLAILMADLVLPWMNDLGGWQLKLPFDDPAFWLILLATWFVTALIASLYPGYVIRRILPSQALKDQVGRQFSGLSLRKGLIVVQFAVSILMIAGTLIIYQQLKHLRQLDKGFEMENLMVIDINSGNLRRDFAAVKGEIRKLPSVRNVSVSSRIPGEWKNIPLARVRPQGDQQPLTEATYLAADEDFISTFGIELTNGRNFTGGEADSMHVLISESLAEQLRMDDALGEVLDIPEINWSGNIEEFENVFRPRIIGVFKDFQVESFHTDPRPIVLGFRNNPIHNIDYYTVKFSGDGAETLEGIRAINRQFDAENPVEHHFLDEEFQRFFRDDRVRSNLFLIVAVLVILISCFGLFALASYEIRRKTREVGIRKVLGASALQLTRMLLTDFLSLVAIAFIIAAPIAIWLGRDWLSDFSSQLSIPWVYYLMAGILTLVLAALTTGILTYRAANTKPVDTLRSE